jgi:NHL repeat
MTTWKLVLVLVPTLGLCACTGKTPGYCDETTPCDPGFVCNLERNACEIAKYDGGPEAGADSSADTSPSPDTVRDFSSDILFPDLSAKDTVSDAGCTQNADCDDGLPCTTDTCSAKACAYKLKGGFCVINNQCITTGTVNPKNQCEKCDSTKNTKTWLPISGAKCDDGVACTHTDSCVSGQCKGTAYTCNDSLTCTKDTCTGKGPAPSGCTFAISTGNCVISNKCYTNGAVDPANSCNKCISSFRNNAWSPATGCVATFAGSTMGDADGDLLSAKFGEIRGIAITPSGTVYFVDEQRIKKAESGKVTTVAGTGQKGFADGPALKSKFYNPSGIAVDKTGAVLIADTENNRIRKLSSSVVSTFAGTASSGSTDGPVLSASFFIPRDLTIDSSGDIFVTDGENHNIRSISSGIVATVAGTGQLGYLDGPVAKAQFNDLNTITVTGAGVIFLTDDSQIRSISAGTVSTYAGSWPPGFLDGTLSTAKFGPSLEMSIAVTASGTIYVADSFNLRVRKIASGKVSTIAGDGNLGSLDGPAAKARFKGLGAIAIHPNGMLFVADGNFRIRIITPP